MVLNREYWRLGTTMFLHGGLIHLAMNMWGLYAVGPLVERLYGNLPFAIIYLASGVAGALASLAAYPFEQVSRFRERFAEFSARLPPS